MQPLGTCSTLKTALSARKARGESRCRTTRPTQSATTRRRRALGRWVHELEEGQEDHQALGVHVTGREDEPENTEAPQAR